MTGWPKTIVAAVGIIFAVAALVTSPARAQGIGKKGHHGAAPSETKPKVDDKAYKAALDRIPTPKKPYDPWGQVHDATPEKSPKK
jgi:hypothetical protein